MKYKIELARVEYLSQVIEVEADSQDQAIDMAWDQSGKWQCVEAEEFTNNVGAV
jgi:hypothetical protein